MPIHFTVELPAFDELQRKAESELEVLVKSAVIATGKVVKQQAKQGNFKDHTRQLRSTIQDRNLGKRGPWYMVEVVSPMFYSSFVEKGTGPHDIWPKAGHNLKGPVRNGQTRRAMGKGPHEHIVGRGIALRWMVGGVSVFARYVHHPGGRPIPFMEPAADRGRSYIYDFVQRGFAGISTRLESHG